MRWGAGVNRTFGIRRWGSVTVFDAGRNSRGKAEGFAGAHRVSGLLGGRADEMPAKYAKSRENMEVSPFLFVPFVGVSMESAVP